ncbi:hypothetical protein X801_04767, partial [Opisthorchis viverrini]
ISYLLRNSIVTYSTEQSPAITYYFIFAPVFVQNYARWSSYANCLEPLLQHEDAQVTILPETLVEKVLFDPHKPGFVKGVVVAHKSASFPIWLSNASEANPIHPLPEVILSAGTFESPAILLRSGIGMDLKPQTTDYITVAHCLF